MQLGLGPGIAQLIARRADQLEGLLQAVQQASRLGSGLHLATRRSNSVAPSCSSSWRIWWLTALSVTHSSAAARPK